MEAQNYRFNLSLLDEQGNELKNNKDVKNKCIIHHGISVELRDPNTTHHQRTWTCQVTDGGQVQTSNYTIIVKEFPHSTGPTPSIGPILIAGVGASIGLVATLLMVIIIVVIRKRKTNNGREAQNQSTQSRTSINLDTVPQANSSAKVEEESTELHYAAFQPLSLTRAAPTAKQSDDSVTYDTIMPLSNREKKKSSPVDPCAMDDAPVSGRGPESVAPLNWDSGLDGW
ncbi:uncharacterized protein LOC134070598 [Sardina pilchardus]|uniref:uncharacterized protein LOC134070598 n=1 Tax=Sardina pilchardus TaxID=27697 RepID=UPI002E12A81F